ncbi:hypothetical protein DMB66_11135 [Actinoplanes sp. ATCC 53533]|uniref:hypothetical protein n=1 Tax=Actinoplanes sp. ATCC 53533 TaxID=1288362 RepID=UPI000F788FE5|nr:hypothetical protein [Actinoplanes sp. ATCC 53533]RSM69541.1 hypothetical protein DMB66_11135 [Actinoplanes sp. ATCC 53533]
MLGSQRAFGLAACAAAFAAVVLPSSAASADTVESPIGTVTAGQYLGIYCDDLGAHVRVTVSGGLASASYTATGSGFWAPTTTFVTDAAGAGLTDLHSVNIPGGNGVGTAVITVTAAGTTVSVPAAINCPGNKGD